MGTNIKLLKDTNVFEAGHVLSPDSHTAAVMVKNGKAEYTDEECTDCGCEDCEGNKSEMTITGSSAMKANEAIDKINSFDSVEEIESFLNGDERKGVNAAAQSRIEELNGKD